MALRNSAETITSDNEVEITEELRENPGKGPEYRPARNVRSAAARVCKRPCCDGAGEMVPAQTEERQAFPQIVGYVYYHAKTARQPSQRFSSRPPRPAEHNGSEGIICVTPCSETNRR